MSTQASDVRVVSFTDPRYVFEHRARNDALLNRKPGDPQVITDVGLPSALVEQFGGFKEALAEFDDPGNTWVVGEEGELFEYEFVGSQYARSGLICAVPQEHVMLEDPPGKAKWKRFRDRALRVAKVPPSELPLRMLFCGRVVGSDAVGIYVLRRQGITTGLMIVSMF